MIPTEAPDWTGVPFHEANPAIAAQDNTPLNDPRDPSNRKAAPIRHPGDPAPASSARPASPRSSGAATTSRIPVPPSMAEAAARRTSPASQPSARVAARPTKSASIRTSTFQPPSSTESSRRSRRREVDPLHVEVRPEEIVQRNAPQPTAAKTPSEPRVARRELPSNQLESGTSNTSEPPSVSRTPAPSSRRQAVSANSTARDAAAPSRAEVAAATPAQTSAASQSSAPAETSSQAPRETEAITWRPARKDVPAASNEQIATSQPELSAPTASSFAPATPAAAPAAPLPAATATAPSVNSRSLPAAGQTMELQAPGQAASVNPPAATATANNLDRATMSGSSADDVPQIAAPTPSSALPSPATPSVGTPQLGSGQSNGATGGLAETPHRQSIDVRSEIPGLRVITTGPADIPVRQSSIYQIVVENRGAMDAPGAAIQIKLPSWIEVQNLIPSRGEIARQNDNSGRQLLWVVEGLPRQTNERLTLHLAAQRAEAFDVDVEWAVVPQSNKAHVSVREPKLEMVIEGPDQVIYGQSETYTVRVLNPGNGEANNVVFTLSPNSATPQTQRVASIPAGKEAKFEVELTARDLENLQIHGLATADLSLKQERVKTIEVISSRLRAVLSGPALNYQDSYADYRLQLTNDGTAACQNIVAVVELPPGVVYRGGLTGAQVEGNLVKWTIAELAADQSAEFDFQCQMQRTGEQRIGFRCQGTAAGATSVVFQTRVEALADLVLTINDPPAPAPVGEEVIYEIVVHNRGSKEATDVVALAQFGPDVEPIRVAGSEGDIEPGQVKFHTIGKLAAGETKRLKVVARAEKAGHHRFRAEVQCGDTLLIAEEATRYLELVGQRISRRSDESPSDR